MFMNLVLLLPLDFSCWVLEHNEHLSLTNEDSARTEETMNHVRMEDKTSLQEASDL